MCSNVAGSLIVFAFPENWCRDFFTGDVKILPFWCRSVALVMCVLIMAASGTFTILYGMQFGKSKSTEWLMSFMLSFLEAEGIISPLKVRTRMRRNIVRMY